MLYNKKTEKNCTIKNVIFKNLIKEIFCRLIIIMIWYEH